MNKKIDSLQALRFIACLCIFLHHCYLIKMVYWGVSLFIVLSGFLMCLSYYDRYDAPLSPLVSLRFSLGKIRKLYLLNVLTMLPVLALDIYMMRFHQTYTPEYVVTETVLNLLVVQSWSPAYAFSLNGVAWYLSASMFFYFAFPYILRAIKGYRRSSDPFCAIAVLFALEILLGFAAEPLGRALYGADNSGFVTWFGYIFPVYRCLDFAVGCNLGYIFLRHGDKLTRRGAESVLGKCLNISADAFLSARFCRLRDSGITLDLDIELPAKTGIPDADLISAIGNLLDNAEEACRSTADRRISMSAKLSGEYLVMLSISCAVPKRALSISRRV